MFRVREKAYKGYTGLYWVNNGFWIDSGSYSLSNSEYCADSTHDMASMGIGDQGGPLDIIKQVYQCAPVRVDGVFRGDTVHGDVVPQHLYVDDSPEIGQVAVLSELDLISRGTTAISRTAPTNPSFSLSRSIGEIRADGIPKIPGSALRDRSKFLKNSGNEYLNVEFGWAPLVSDLISFAQTVKKSDAIISQYRKASDTKIRRGYSFPSSDVNMAFKSGDGRAGSAVPYPGNLAVAGGLGVGFQTTSIHSESWFRGAFRYHVPVGDSLSDKLAVWSSNADKLLGISLTPEVVYNLTPWTWALDWFSNTGDVMNNISQMGHDGLVLQYGYIMDKYLLRRDITATFPNFPAGKYAAMSYEKKILKRRGATPYGFGFDIKTLTAGQDAILIALGLSKGLR